MDNDAADRAADSIPDTPEFSAYDDTVVFASINVRGDLTASQLRAIAEVAEVLTMNFGEPLITQRYGSIELELSIVDRVVRTNDASRVEVGRKRYVKAGARKQDVPADDYVRNAHGYDDEPF